MLPEVKVSTMAENAVTPQYACDEKKKEGYVRVIVGIRNLKTSRQMKGLKFVKKPENATVEVHFQEQSFQMSVEGKQKGDLKGKTFKLHIRKLPKPIAVDSSFYEVEDDRVLLFLCKAEKTSWYPELESGLETAEEEEEEGMDQEAK